MDVVDKYLPVVTEDCGVESWSHVGTPAHPAWGSVTGWQVQVNGGDRVEYTPGTAIELPEGAWEVGFFVLYEKLPNGQQWGRSKGVTDACVIEEPEVPVEEPEEPALIVPDMEIPVEPELEAVTTVPVDDVPMLAETGGDPTGWVLAAVLIVAGGALMLRRLVVRS